MDYADLVRTDLPPCVLIKQFLDSEKIVKSRTFPVFVGYLDEVIEIARTCFITEENTEQLKSYFEHLEREIEENKSRDNSEEVSLEGCILINEFVERFPSLKYAFMGAHYRFRAKENEEVSFDISVVGLHPVQHISIDAYEDYEAIQSEIVSQAKLKLKSAEFFKEAQGTNLMYRMEKAFGKDSLFGYIARRNISESTREKERENKVIQPLINELEKVVEENKVILNKIPYTEILLTYDKNTKRGGFNFPKGRIDLDNLIYYDGEIDYKKIDEWGISNNYTKTEETIVRFLTKIDQEINNKNIALSVIYLLLQIYNKREFNEKRPMGGIPSFYYEPAALLGQGFQDFRKSIQITESLYSKYHLKYLDDLFKKTFEIFNSAFRNLIGHAYWISQYEEPFYEEVVDVFLALLISRWLIIYNPERIKEVFQLLREFFKKFFVFKQLDERVSQYLKALFKYKLTEFVQDNRILSDLFEKKREETYVFEEDINTLIGEIQNKNTFLECKDFLNHIFTSNEVTLRSFIYRLMEEWEEDVANYAFTEMIRRNWFPETLEEQITYNLRIGNWEELCKIEDEQAIKHLRKKLLERDAKESFNIYYNRDKREILSQLAENKLAIDLFIEIADNEDIELSSTSIYSLQEIALKGNKKALDYFLSKKIKHLTDSNEAPIIFSIGELAKNGNKKAIDFIIEYSKFFFQEKLSDLQVSIRANLIESTNFFNKLIDLMFCLDSDEIIDLLVEQARIENPFQSTILGRLSDIKDKRVEKLFLDIYRGDFTIDSKKIVAKEIGKKYVNHAITLSEKIILESEFFTNFYKEGRDRKTPKELVNEMYSDEQSKEDFYLLNELIQGLAENGSYNAFEYLTSLLLQQHTSVIWDYTNIGSSYYSFNEQKITRLLDIYDKIPEHLKIIVGGVFGRMSELQRSKRKGEIRAILRELLEKTKGSSSDLHLMFEKLIVLHPPENQDYSELEEMVVKLYKNSKISIGSYFYFKIMRSFPEDSRKKITTILKKDDYHIFKHPQRRRIHLIGLKEHNVKLDEPEVLEGDSEKESTLLIDDILDSEQKETIRQEVLDAFRSMSKINQFIGIRTFLTEEDEMKLKWRDVEQRLSKNPEEFIQDLEEIIFSEEAEVRLRRIAIHDYAKLFFAYSFSTRKKERKRRRDKILPLLKHDNKDIRAQVVYSLIFKIRFTGGLEFEEIEDELISMKERFIEAVFDQLKYDKNQREYFDSEDYYIKLLEEEAGLENFDILHEIIRKISNEYKEIKNVLLKYLDDSDVRIRLLAFELLIALEKGSEKISKDLENVISRMQTDTEIEKNEILRILKTLEAFWTLENLLSSLQSNDYSIRKKALKLIEKNKDERLVDLLIEAFHKENSQKLHIIDSLKKIGDKRAIPLLIEGLKDENKSVRTYSASALNLLQAHEAVEPLIELLEDEETSVRKAAIASLGNLGDQKTAQLLIPFLQDEDSTVRHATVVALGSLGDKKAIVPLVNLLKEEQDKHHKRSIINSLGRLEASQAIDLLIEEYKDTESTVRVAAINALSNFDDPRIRPFLINALNDNSPGPIKSAVEALAKEGVETLKSLLSHENEYVVQLAIEEIAKIKSKPAIEALLNVLKKKDFKLKQSAIYALKENGDSSIVEPLMEMLVEEGWYNRTAILETIEEFKDEKIIEIAYTSTIESYKNETDSGTKRSMIYFLADFLEERSEEFLKEIQEIETNSELKQLIQEELEELEEEL